MTWHVTWPGMPELLGDDGRAEHARSCERAGCWSSGPTAPSPYHQLSRSDGRSDNVHVTLSEQTGEAILQAARRVKRW